MHLGATTDTCIDLTDGVTLTGCVIWLRLAQDGQSVANARLIDDVIEDLYSLGGVDNDNVELILGAIGSVQTTLELRPHETLHRVA